MQQIVLSWSGGKDSVLALDRLRRDPGVAVSLLANVTAPLDRTSVRRVSVHGIRRALLHAQAAALGLAIHETLLPVSPSNTEYDSATNESLTRMKSLYPDLQRIAFGDLFLEDIRRYREERLSVVGLTAEFPLWGLDTAELAREFIDRGFDARLVCVDTTQLDARFVGRRYDHALLDELPPTVDPCGERGEFHTFVCNGPGFRSEIPVTIGDERLEGKFAYCDLL